jgi:di/tricarboxylate transporter
VLEPIILSVVLIILLILFVTEGIHYDIAGLLAVLSLVVLTELNIGINIISAYDAFSGFANKAVITIAAMFIISAGLMRTGAVGYLGDKIISLSKGQPFRLLFLTMITVGLSSAFVNNTPVVVLFVPIMMRICFQYNLSPSKYLIPISYTSILGGASTLIGSSANIVVSEMAWKIGQVNESLHLHKFSMFEFAALGLPIAVAGVIIISLFGRQLLPDRRTVSSTLAQTKQKTFMTELQIPSGSSSIGKTPQEVFLDVMPNLTIMEIIREEDILYPPINEIELKENDVLLVKGSVNDILSLQKKDTAEIAPGLGSDNIRLSEHQYTLAEVVVMPTSQFEGKSIQEVGFKRRFDVNVMAILRKGRHLHIRDKIMNVVLGVGDTLLVQGGEDGLNKLRKSENVLLLEGIGTTVINTSKAPIAISTILGVVVLASMNILPISVLAMIGACIMVLTNCVSLKQAYKSMDAPVLTLIASTIGMGIAMENTGTAELYADFLVKQVLHFGPVAVLGVLFVLTMLLANYVNKSAAAVLMVPVAIAASQSQGVGFEPMPFVMAVLFGATACFLTPIGYQTNLFIYGPGGYKFNDYLRLGVPLVLMVFIMSMLFIPVIWPFVPMN